MHLNRGLREMAEARDRVFERFRRGANVGGYIGGTRIALAGVRSLVDSHGGAVSVASQEGAVSTFTLRLPLLS